MRALNFLLILFFLSAVSARARNRRSIEHQVELDLLTDPANPTDEVNHEGVIMKRQIIRPADTAVEYPLLNLPYDVMSFVFKIISPIMRGISLIPTDVLDFIKNILIFVNNILTSVKIMVEKLLHEIFHPL